MKRMRLVPWHKTAIGTILGLIVLVVIGSWGWDVLVGYVEPKGPTGRKDVVQVFALIVAGVVAFIGGIVGIANLFVAQRNLRQQRELGDQRAEEDALQAYFEQMGSLLTDQNLISTDRDDIKHLAEAQTLTVLARLDGERKGSVVRFLYGARLINRDQTIVDLSGATLTGTILIRADLRDANF
jgi:Pentapeptide repeats (8 copies)